MCRKLIKLLTNCLVILLLFELNSVIFCQNTNNNNKNKTSDDYVYEYDGIGDNTTTTDTVPKATGAKPRADDAPNDDFVYDYVSGAQDNNTNDLKDNNKNITSSVVYDSEESEESSDGSGNETAVTESADDDKPTTEEDLGYDDETSSGDCEEKETLLQKMLRLHEENLNITNDYKIKHVKHINDTFERLKYVRGLYEKYFQQDKNFGTELLAFVSSIDIVLTPECFASFFALISGLRNNKLWANKFMDTMGRFFETGTIDGKHSSFGEYDECLDIESPEDKGLIVKGQYCLVKVIVPYPAVSSYSSGDPYDPLFDEKGITPFKYFNGANATTVIRMIENLNIYNGSAFRLGLCTPHLCKRNEVNEFINKVLYPITRLPLEVSRYCERRDKSEDFTVLQIIAMAIVALLAIITISSTGIEIYNIIYEKSIIEDNNNLGDVKYAPEEPPIVSPYYYVFSLVTNTRELLAKNNRFAALDTIRLFVIMHIYVFHLYNTWATIGIVTLKRAFATFPSLVLEYDRYTTMRNTLIFDILFIMSGFILANSILGKLSRNAGNFNYFKYLVSRYLRFAVPMFGSIIFFLILPTLGSGPIWDEGVQWVNKGCESPLVVLFGLLFISNYNDQLGIMERQAAVPYCNPSTWLVSALFQLHILVPGLVIIYYKWPKKGLYAIGGAIAVGMLLSIAPTLIFRIVPQMQYIQIESYEQLFQSFTWYHLSTTQYIVSFLVGVVGGYMIRQDFNLPVEYEVIGWSASVLSIVVVFMWSNTFWKPQKSAALYSVLLWFTFGKLFFAAAFAWIFFCLCTGRAQTLNYLLSWSNFQPFARLSFSFFMVHFMIIIRRVFTVKETITMSDGLMIENSIIDIMVTFCLAYVFYSLVEAPFTNLMTIWLKKDVDENDNTFKNGDAHAIKSLPLYEKRDLGHINEIELEEDVNKNTDFETIRI